MAEDDKSNPFSFKTFLKRGEGPTQAPPPGDARKITKKKGGKKKESELPFPDDVTGKEEGLRLAS